MANDTEVPVIPDPFLDDDFGGLDTRGENGGGSLAEQLEAIAAEDRPANAAEPIVPEAAAAPVESDEPQVHEYEDGSSVTIEKGNKGWKATLDSNTGANPEIFYGRTKDELLLNLSAGKINATQRIREFNKREKLGLDGPGEIEPVAQLPNVIVASSGRALTADEIFEIKTKLQDNPDEALANWFQKKTGLTIEQLTQLAQSGAAAATELSAEAVAKDFIGRHPEYIAYERNFAALIGWLCKYKLGQPLAGRDPNSMIEPLHRAGFFTPQGLDKAYEDLVNDGLLDIRAEEESTVEDTPVIEETPAKPVAVPSTQTPNSERIARVERRPRAGLGIRTRETTSVPVPDVTRSPSADELDNLSDEAIAGLLAGVRKQRLGTQRQR